MRSLRWPLIVQFLVWAAVSATAQLPQCPLRPSPGTVVLDAPSLSSQNGALSLDLTMRNASDSSGFMHYCFDYMSSTGLVEAPTLRVNPGDTLTINFTNALTATSAVVLPNSRHAAQHVHAMADAPGSDPCSSKIMNSATTNIHFHGMNIPPVCHQDDVVNTLIQPSSTPFQYQIQIPANEPPGLYWYHPHPHGFTSLQVNGGAAGAIIVNGIEKIKPQVAGLGERVFFIREQVPSTSNDEVSSQLTLNFQPAIYPLLPSPIIQMKAGEKQFWRVANASTSKFLSLEVLFAGAAQSLELISLDGVPVTGDPFLKSIDMPPAGRAEFIVTGPPAGTAATFIHKGFDTGPVGDPSKSQVLASIVTTAASAQTPASVAASMPARVVTQRFSGLASIKPTTTRKLYFAESSLGTNGPVNFFIAVDGQLPKLFSMSDPPAIVTNVGAVEEWTIENRTPEEHAFHMHQIHFLVTAINGVSIANPTLQDTFSVPYWKGKGPYPSITVRMDFRDPEIAGTFVYHCHILDHEDGGMMAKIQVNP
ncbi:MAG TPA: multicopper oxidase domain-containing protein [Dongiaceae bacterium]|nr:multicopper oxidase domain-containing protein [Dongiaceae bacterium]